MNIGEAIKELKEGKKIRRSNWSNNDKFIFLQVASSINKEIVGKMQSLPMSVKDYFNETFEKEQIDAIYYNNQIAKVGLSNLIQSYSPTNEDILSEDWIVI